jgi:hypothetical protein
MYNSSILMNLLTVNFVNNESDPALYADVPITLLQIMEAFFMNMVAPFSCFSSAAAKKKALSLSLYVSKRKLKTEREREN